MAKVAGIILLVENIDESVDFYRKLGFQVQKVVRDAATTLGMGDFWVELLHKSKVVSEQYKQDIQSPNKGAGAYLQIQVDDIDDFYQAVVDMGIKPAGQPKNFAWGHREFVAVDPDGYKLAFFQPI